MARCERRFRSFLYWCHSSVIMWANKNDVKFIFNRLALVRKFLQRMLAEQR